LDIAYKLSESTDQNIISDKFYEYLDKGYKSVCARAHARARMCTLA